MIRRPPSWLAPAVAGAAGIVLLGWPSIRLPAHRGGTRVTEGFRPARWDARFRVARGPAALQASGSAVQATLILSGPARLVVRAGEAESRYEVAAEQTAVPVSLPAHGRAELTADGTLRLHEIELRREGPPPWPRMALLFVVALAGGLLARARPAVSGTAMVTVLVLAGALMRGQMGGLVLVGLLDRSAPALALLALGSAFLVPAAFPAAAAVPASAGRLPSVFAALMLVSASAQVLLLPQPLLIGDPAAYFDIGGRFAEGLRSFRSLDGIGDAVQSLRPYGGLWAAGLVYGVLRLASDGVRLIYVAHAAAMAGAVFFLTRAAARIGGRRLAALTGALAVVYPTLAVICGIVQPEPFILLLWAWALERWLAARAGEGLRSAAVAGLLFGLGLALHPQGMWFLLVAFGLALAPFARVLLARGRRLVVGAVGAGLLPVVLLTAAGEAYARPVADVLEERYGFWAYTARYPIGFWLFIDTDGWQGPLRLDETRYAAGFRQAESEGRMDARLDRLLYTARFVAGNARACARTVLRNLDRLWRVPDNPPRRGWLLPWAAQLRWHRVLLVSFLLAAPLALARGAAPLLLPFAMLSLTYPLYHVFNKYALPAAPFLLLGAALALDRLISTRPRALLAALAVAALASLVTPAALALHGLPPAAARAAADGLHGLALAAAFVLAGRAWASNRVGGMLAAGAAAVLLVPWLAARAPDWRRFAVPLDRAVRHEIAFDAAALADLSAGESYLMLDLQVEDGDPRRIRLDFDGGFSLPGSALEPTMPPFGLATARFGRDPRAFPEWWRTRWRPEMAPGGRLALDLRGTARERLGGDVGTPDAEGVYDGLSLGEWPRLSVYRLMHEDEYRLPVRQPLAASTRVSRVAGRVVPGILGVRVVVVETADEAPGAGSAPRWRPVHVW